MSYDSNNKQNWHLSRITSLNFQLGFFVASKLQQSRNCSVMRVETDNDFDNVAHNQVWIESGLEEAFDGDNRKKFELKNLMCCIIGNCLMTIFFFLSIHTSLATL